MTLSLLLRSCLALALGVAGCGGEERNKRQQEVANITSDTAVLEEASSAANAVIRNNMIRRNNWVDGRRYADRGDSFPFATVYLSEAGGISFERERAVGVEGDRDPLLGRRSARLLNRRGREIREVDRLRVQLEQIGLDLCHEQ